MADQHGVLSHDDKPDEGYEPTSPWWLSGTPLEAEHHRLMRRRSTPIPWDATTPDPNNPCNPCNPCRPRGGDDEEGGMGRGFILS